MRTDSSLLRLEDSLDQSSLSFVDVWTDNTPFRSSRTLIFDDFIHAGRASHGAVLGVSELYRRPIFSNGARGCPRE